MRIAVLFDSGNPKYVGMGEWPIRDSILKTDVIQLSERHVKIRIGDVLIFSHSRSTAHYEERPKASTSHNLGNYLTHRPYEKRI